MQHFGLIGLNFPVEWKFDDGDAEAGEWEEFCKIFMRLLKDGSQKIDSRNKFLFEFVSIEQLEDDHRNDDLGFAFTHIQLYGASIDVLLFS